MTWSLISLTICICSVGIGRGTNFELQGTLNLGKYVLSAIKSNLNVALGMIPKQIGRQGDSEAEAETDEPTLIISRPRNLSIVWAVHTHEVPNASVQFYDYVFNMPSDPDVDLVTEGKRVRTKLLYSINDLMFKIRDENPDKRSPMMRVLIRAWRYEYKKELDVMVDSLERTKNLRYIEKMQIWIDFLMKAEAIFNKVSTKFINAIIPTYPKKHPKWIKKRKDIAKAQKYGFFRTMESFKATELRSVCRKFGNCLYTKTFWDHVADWLAQVLRASPTKHKEFFAALVTEVELIYYSDVIKRKLFDDVRSYINKLGDSEDYKYFSLLSLVYESIVNRYKPINDIEPVVLQQTKLFRTILLIIDKTYQSNDDDEEWKIVTRQIRRWRLGIRDYVADLLHEEFDKFYEDYEYWDEVYQISLVNNVNDLIRDIVKENVQLAKYTKDTDEAAQLWFEDSEDEYAG